ncbi:hypothetical protein [Fluviicola taffensis]|uniref:hypothetical protein n=1 Tax=Fluviicola taffensis TaxID=191579 RepID=UPI003137C279
MKYDLLLLSTSFLLMLLSILTFYFKVKRGANLFYLVSMCSILWAAVIGFLYEFPLEEGMVPENQILIYERGAGVSFTLFLLSIILLILLILKYYRIKR